MTSDNFSRKETIWLTAETVGIPVGIAISATELLIFATIYLIAPC